MGMMELNWLAIVAAALSAFAIGGVWYGPLFLKTWSREAGIDMTVKQRHPAAVFGTAFVAALLAAIAFAILLGPRPSLALGVHHGLLAGLFIAGASFAINYAFAGRSLKLWLIDGGYHTVQFVVYGIILGLWH